MSQPRRRHEADELIRHDVAGSGRARQRNTDYFRTASTRYLGTACWCFSLGHGVYGGRRANALAAYKR